MARIRSKDTGPELALRRELHRMGWRYRLHARRLPGTPDVVFPSAMVAVFVDGDFWHGRARIPKTRAAWWGEKLLRNRLRDRRASAALRRLGWRVVRVRDSSLRTPAAIREAASSVAELLIVRRLFGRPRPRRRPHRLSTRSTGSELASAP